MHYFQGSREHRHPPGPQHFDFTGGLGTGSVHVKNPQTRIISLCVSIAFLCMSVYLSV